MASESSLNIIQEENGMWFVEGTEVNHVSKGRTKREAIRNFTRSFDLRLRKLCTNFKTSEEVEKALSY